MVPPERTVLIGIRNLDEREKEIVKASGVHVFTMKDVDRLGIAAVMDRALSIAGAGHGAASTSRSTSTLRPARRARRRARRSRAASTTARRTR